jgi:nitrogen regulatory protein PII
MEGREVSLLTAVVKRGLTQSLLSALNGAGMTDCHTSLARTIVLQEKRKGLGLVQPFKLVEDQVDIINLIVDPDQEDPVLDFVIHHGELTFPGRGTVFSERVTLMEPSAFQREERLSAGVPAVYKKQSPLTGLCCIVQRGQANMVARVALDMGACVPTVSFGYGTGVRDKLGLLRIAIPAEKEIIHLAMSGYDADMVMKMMIGAGNLDQPGKGFIYTYPIHKGLIDTKITRGITRHVASIEQIIATLDEIKGDIGWRRRSGKEMIETSDRYLLRDLMDLTLICNYGRGQDLVKEAMRAGAGGATISRMKYLSPPDGRSKGISPARETCSMAVQAKEKDRILDALKEAGAFDEQTCGQILIRPVPNAYTYSRS